MSNLKLDSWCLLPTAMGQFRMYDTGDETLRVVCLGNLHEQGSRPLVRMHSSCLASEVFGALDCDCADQLRESMKRIAHEGRGIVIHLHQEGRGHGLAKKIRAVHAMQCDGLDTVEAFDALGLAQDIRGYRAAVDVLRALKIDAVRLISNNPRKAEYLRKRGFQTDMVGTHPTIRPENADYLRTKKIKLEHALALGEADTDEGEVRFYHSDQPWGALANFSRHAVFLHDKMWPTVEHFYQAQKFGDAATQERIRCSATPILAKIRAGELKSARRVDWEYVKDSMMLLGLRTKFTQHPDLGKSLLSTRDRRLVEDTDQDPYWGRDTAGIGRNRLGELLMQVRSELRSCDGHFGDSRRSDGGKDCRDDCGETDGEDGGEDGGDYRDGDSAMGCGGAT